MVITLKLFATLGHLLPEHAKRNQADVEINPTATLNDIIQEYKIPPELAHLVLINGVYHCETDRNKAGILKPGDVLAIWPPVAGG